MSRWLVAMRGLVVMMGMGIGMAACAGATLLRCDFAQDPRTTGWSAWAPDNAGAVPLWAEGVAHSGTRYLAATRGRWRSPMIPVTPGAYYLAEAFTRGDGPGLWHALYFDAAGKTLDAAVDVATAKSGICTGTDASADWQRQVMCFRATPGVTHAQLLFEPRQDKLLAIDDVTVRAATWQEAAQWAEAVYATVPPVACTPPADRWRLLPRTRETLRAGGILRMVLLGSSNMNDMASGYPELLLRRRGPKTIVEAITSVRGSTGCNFFQAPAQVKAYILDHQPDVVLIECSAFDSTVASVRSVVTQVRAAGPAEIVLVTSAWYDKAWLTPLDPAGTDFYAGVQRLAAEEHVAFLDMTRPVTRYFTDCGRPYADFRRDTYHYNDRGKQVMAQLLAAFLAVR